MKSALIFATVATVALGLQGCAGTGDVVYANGASPAAGGETSPAAPRWEATGPDTAVIKEAAPSGEPVLKADTKENFEAVVAAIQKQMEPGGRWQFVNDSERKTIDRNFADMQKLYDEYGSVGKMDASAKTHLLVDQSSINAILTKKDGDKLICESSVPVGSHLPVKTCKTYAQIQAERQRVQQALQRREATLQTVQPGTH